MVLAGLALAAYVFAAWPDTSMQVVRLPNGEAMPKVAATQAEPVRETTSVSSYDEAYPESELAGVAGAVYPGDLYVFELGPSPLLDAVIAAPLAVDAQ